MFSFSGPMHSWTTPALSIIIYKIKKYPPLRIPDISLENLVLILEFPEVGFGSCAISGNGSSFEWKQKKFFYGIFSTHTMIVVHFWAFLRPFSIGDFKWDLPDNYDKCLFSRHYRYKDKNTDGFFKNKNTPAASFTSAIKNKIKFLPAAFICWKNWPAKLNINFITIEKRLS